MTPRGFAIILKPGVTARALALRPFSPTATLLILASGLIACGGGATDSASPPPPPPSPGSIAGTLQVVPDARGLGGVTVTLRRASGDSLTSAVTDSAGAFGFPSLSAGGYRVGARLPAGHRADVATDTLQQLTVTSGAETPVRLQAHPITAVVDTVRAGASDTVTLSSGAWVVVALPAGAAPIVVNVRSAPTDSSTWGRSTIGAAVEVALPATSGVQARMSPSRSGAAQLAVDPGTISFALPVTNLPAGPRQAVVRGMFEGPGSGGALVGLVPSQAQSGANPSTGKTQTYLIGQIPFSPSQLTKLRLAAVSALLVCPEQMSMAQDTAFAGNEPLLLIHGIQLQLDDCDENTTYDPALETFKDLIAALKNDPGVRSRYSLHTFKYPTNHGVQNAASGLAQPIFLPRLASRSGAKVTIIAHSMGGLVARRYLRDNGDTEIAHVLTLATPHQGTELADAGSKVLNLSVNGCYSFYANNHPFTLPPWFLLVGLEPFFLQGQGDQGLRDLSADHPTLGTSEPYARIITTFAGERSPPILEHGFFENGVLTWGSCYLGLAGFSSYDGVVSVVRAKLPGSRAFGPFPRDHVQMTGADAQGVNDTFVATIIKLLLPSPVQVTSNAATTWTLNPGGLSGSGTSGTFSVMPAPSGTVYTLSAQSIAGRTLTITNSNGGGSAVTIFPGDAVSFTIAYGGSAPPIPPAPTNLAGIGGTSSVSLTWSDNSNNEDGFQIERAPGATTTFTQIATTGPSIAAYVDQALAPGSSYAYRVRAYNSAGSSAFTNTAAVSVPVAAAPTIRLSSTSATFSATSGGANPAAQSIAITNSGTGTLSGLSASVSYQSGQPSGWLASSSNTSTAPATLTLTPTVGALLGGTYNATVAIASSASGVTNSPQTISVTLTITFAAQFSQQGPKLVGTGAVGTARQGAAVSVSADGNTAIVGAPSDNGEAGAAWVWTRNGGVWTQQGNKLVGSGAVGSARQGSSVSLSADGNTAIVGGGDDNGNAGGAWVWTRSGGVWTQQGPKLVGSNASTDAQQGRSVALSADGNTAIVGGEGDNSTAGAAWVWTRTGGVWTQQGAKLIGAGAVGLAQQGVSVSLSADGSTAIVGGYADDFGGSGAGAAWIWTRGGGIWTQQGPKLVGSGRVGNSQQGVSVSLSADGNTAMVGGWFDNSTAGAAWVWTRNGGSWTQQGTKLVGSGAVGNSQQGVSVSLSADGNTAMVGGWLDNSAAGAAWVWTRSGGIWAQQGTKLVGSDAVRDAVQGRSVSLTADGKTAIFGGYGDNSSAGAAWVFTRGGANGVPSSAARPSVRSKPGSFSRR